LAEESTTQAGTHDPFNEPCSVENPSSQFSTVPYDRSALVVTCLRSETNHPMPDDDFDIAGLADYLHISAAQVAKMAERGQLPARRVAGQWRFSPSEVHHWLEQRIGALDELELGQLETALERSAPPAAEAVSIAELLPLEAIAIPLPARTRSSVITSMCELAAQTGWLWDPERMAEIVRQREDLYPTALDNGVALLHPRRPSPAMLAQPFLAFGRTSQGIPFSGNRGLLTDLFFLILSTDDQGHLRVLARLSRMLADNEFLAALRTAESARQAREVILEREQTITN